MSTPNNLSSRIVIVALALVCLASWATLLNHAHNERVGPDPSHQTIASRISVNEVAIQAFTVTQGPAQAAPPTLGNYANTSIFLSANKTVTPAAAPVSTTSINVSTSTNFKGTFAANPTTGVIAVTDAHPAGSYLVTVKAFDDGGASTTKTFTLTVTSSPACTGTATFTSAPSVNLASSPGGMAIGDFNDDGKQDLAVGNSANTVSIRLGNGASGFAGTTEVSVGAGGHSVAIGDFNNDGKQDLAVTNSGPKTVSIRLGDGSGGFGGTTEVSFAAGPHSVAIGDFNNDGRQDFAVAHFDSNTVSIRLGDGLGGFSGTTAFGLSLSPTSLRIGDFNNDGKQDLAVTVLDPTRFLPGAVVIRLGDGLGGFSGTSEFRVGASLSSMAIGDFNNDGNQDVAVTNTRLTQTVNVLLGDGLGAFSAPSAINVSSTPESVAIGDFNNDGNQDLAVANTTTNTVSIRRGDGLGGFSGSNPPSTEVNVGSSPGSLVIGDFNHDGAQDFATSNASSNNVSIRLGQCQIFFVSISGRVTVGAAGLSGVTMTLSGGQSASTTTDVNGNYSFNNLPVNGNYAVTPSRSGYSFSPTSRSFTDLSNSQTSADFSATPIYRISGQIRNASNTPISDAIVSLSGAKSATAVTDSNGMYSFASLTQGNYVVTPAKTNYTFSPTQRTFVNLSSDQTADFTGTLANYSISGRIVDNGSTGVGGVAVALSGSQSATMVTDANGAYSFTAPGDGNYTVTPSSTNYTFTPQNTTFNSLSQNQTANFSAAPTPATVHFSASQFVVGEGDQRVDINVNRLGNTSAALSVDFATSDLAGAQKCDVVTGVASSRCDYETSISRIKFAAGETLKTVSILIIDDSYLEGNEVFTATLSNPSGASLGSQSTATVSIIENEIASGPNPIDQPGFFVLVHYLDFLNRQPDASGLAFWTNEITSCGMNLQCVEVKRINVSASFFLSIEFQETGYFTERIYKAAYGSGSGNSTLGGAHQLVVPIIKLNEFLPDSQTLSQGVIVGQGNWQQKLDDNKNAFTSEFVERVRFATEFPASLTAAQFVDKLNANAGTPLSQSERNQLVNDLSTNAKTRAQILRAVAEDVDFVNSEFNRAFVLMEYFGYLRRNPNDSPDTDYTGFDFWLTKLNQFNGNYINAEMVKAFLSSMEYRQRFGP